MAFPLGRPVLSMLAIAALSGTLLLLRPPRQDVELKVWVFDESHAASYRQADGGRPSLIEQFAQHRGQRVRVDLISSRALDVRLISLFNSGSAKVPDLVEIEIGSVGKFFRPPVDEVGFLPLNAFLEREGLLDRLVAGRLAPWSKQATIFGVPRDVHPVSIAYRKDLFDQAGVDLGSARTWAEFQERCLAFQAHYRTQQVRGRWAMELPSSSADALSILLLQRRINLIDNQNRVHLDNPKVAQVVAFYAQMVAGERRIGADATPGGNLWTRDLGNGDLGAVLTPDWRVAYLRENARELAGKLAMMPLPRFSPEDAPTSTWGGTMLAIPRRCRDPEASWRLLKFLLLSDEAVAARQRHTDILPPLKEHWKSPLYHRPDPFFGGQKIGQLYVELAGQVPERHVTPFTLLAGQALALVLNRAVDHVNAQGAVGLEAACQRWLREAAEDVRRRVEFGGA